MTFHERAARNGFSGLSERDRFAVYEVMEQTSRESNWLGISGFRDVVHQSPFGMPPHQAYMFAKVLGLWVDGNVGGFAIDVGCEPLPDRCANDNQELLSSGLSSMAKAYVKNDKRDDDGYLTMQQDAAVVTCDKCDVVLAGSQFPLEIGSTSASRTFIHLVLNHGVARWPYGSYLVHVWRLVNPLCLA